MLRGCYEESASLEFTLYPGNRGRLRSLPAVTSWAVAAVPAHHKNSITTSLFGSFYPDCSVTDDLIFTARNSFADN